MVVIEICYRDNNPELNSSVIEVIRIPDQANYFRTTLLHTLRVKCTEGIRCRQ